jgi:hypothetical protein
MTPPIDYADSVADKRRADRQTWCYLYVAGIAWAVILIILVGSAQ